MKATGIVRRIDDLGRVVIPKEIRRTMRIREGDPLEIFTDAQGEVIFKKYSPMRDRTEFMTQYAEVLNKALGVPVFITDRDHVVAYSGAGKREHAEKPVTHALESFMEERACFVRGDDSDALSPAEGAASQAGVVCPILANGDVSGCVGTVFVPNGPAIADSAVKLVQVAAQFLGRQMEE